MANEAEVVTSLSEASKFIKSKFFVLFQSDESGVRCYSGDSALVDQFRGNGLKVQDADVSVEPPPRPRPELPPVYESRLLPTAQPSTSLVPVATDGKAADSVTDYTESCASVDNFLKRWDGWFEEERVRRSLRSGSLPASSNCLAIEPSLSVESGYNTGPSTRSLDGPAASACCVPSLSMVELSSVVKCAIDNDKDSGIFSVGNNHGNPPLQSPPDSKLIPISDVFAQQSIVRSQPGSPLQFPQGSTSGPPAKRFLQRHRNGSRESPQDSPETSPSRVAPSRVRRGRSSATSTVCQILEHQSRRKCEEARISASLQDQDRESRTLTLASLTSSQGDSRYLLVKVVHFAKYTFCASTYFPIHLKSQFFIFTAKGRPF